MKLIVLKAKAESCEACDLCKTRTNVVFGEGNPQAQIVFVGEGPGRTENDTGRPFVGRAGKLLTNMILSIGLKREDVYILNIVKCWPPNNRKPTQEEMNACRPFLVRQLETIQPRVIVALGNTALGGLTGNDGGITKRCGVWEDVEVGYIKSKLMPCFHPSYLLREPKYKDNAWYALNSVRKLLRETI